MSGTASPGWLRKKPPASAKLVVSRVLFVDFGVPPIFYAAARFLVVAIVLCRLLRPLPRPLAPILMIGFLMGTIHFSMICCKQDDGIFS